MSRGLPTSYRFFLGDRGHGTCLPGAWFHARNAIIHVCGNVPNSSGNLRGALQYCFNKVVTTIRPCSWKDSEDLLHLANKLLNKNVSVPYNNT